MKGQHEEPRRPFPVAQSYRDGTPVGEAPDHRAVVRAINHGGTVKPHGASVALAKALDEVPGVVTETPAEELGRLRRELSELNPESPEHRDTLDRIAVLTREAAEKRGSLTVEALNAAIDVVEAQR